MYEGTSFLGNILFVIHLHHLCLYHNLKSQSVLVESPEPNTDPYYQGRCDLNSSIQINITNDKTYSYHPEMSRVVHRCNLYKYRLSSWNSLWVTKRNAAVSLTGLYELQTTLRLYEWVESHRNCSHRRREWVAAARSHSDERCLTPL